MTTNLKAPLTLALFASLLTHQNAQAHECRDILRHGIHDTLHHNHSASNKELARLRFCNIARDSSLSSASFEGFARDYARMNDMFRSNDGSVSAFSSESGGSVGFLGFGGSGSHSESRYDEHNHHLDHRKMSQAEKETYLNNNQEKVLQHFQQQCRNENSEKSSLLEESRSSLIANKDVVQAWRDCVLKRDGLFVRLAPNELDGSDFYNIEVSFISTSPEKESITDLSLIYPSKTVTSIYAKESEHEGFVESTNLCKDGKCLVSTGQRIFTVQHVDQEKNAFVTIRTRSSREIDYDKVVAIPKLVKTPEPIITPVPVPVPVPVPKIVVQDPNKLPTLQLYTFIFKNRISVESFGDPRMLRFNLKHDMRPVLKFRDGTYHVVDFVPEDRS